MHHTFDPLFDPNFSKGQRTGGNAATLDAAIQKCRGVSPAAVHWHIPNHFFIAGCLDIPAKQNVSDPQHRIEPVDAEQQVSRGFPPMVMSADMGLLMGNDIGNVFCIHPGRQVDHRANQPQHKGCIHKLAPLDAFPHGNGSRYPLLQKQAAYQNVREHNSKTNDPDCGKDGDPFLR